MGELQHYAAEVRDHRSKSKYMKTT